MEKDIKSDTKKFILDFFSNSNISEKNGVLTISDVSEDFEQFLGKKAPYTLVFDQDKHNKIDDSELIAKGSYFLLAIRDFMRNRGETSLYKLNIKKEKIDVLKELKIKKSDIKSIEEKEDIKFISRFTFLSIAQYLNKKKQITNHILIKDKRFVDLKLPVLLKGENNIRADIEEDYKAAQKKLHEYIEDETKDIRKNLREKLEKELLRIKKYYDNQIQEKDEEVERVEKKIKLLGAKLKHTYYPRDADILRRLIRESEAQLVKLRNQGYEERLRREKEFHLNDELDKHTLSIENNLLNCSIIYYTCTRYNINLKGKTKKIEAFYDPISKTLTRK